MINGNKILGIIFRNEELGAWILIMLIFAIISFIRYSFPNTIEKSNTQEIVVVLSSKPEYYKGGEYSDSHFSFDTKGYSGVFTIDECTYYLSQNKEMQMLNSGDSLKLIVPKKTSNAEEGNIEVYGIENFKNEKILTLDEFNYAKKNKWKDLWVVVLFISLVLWTFIIGKMIKRKK